MLTTKSKKSQGNEEEEKKNNEQNESKDFDVELKLKFTLILQGNLLTSFQQFNTECNKQLNGENIVNKNFVTVLPSSIELQHLTESIHSLLDYRSVII